jgi:cytosine/adenosine deaminase-related metal-dependent hydrolase
VDDFEAGVAENIRFSRQIAAHPGNMLRAMFGLHAVFSLSDGSLRRCGQAAAELGIGCHLHVAEHRDEVARFAEKHSQHIPAFLADIGILSPKSLLAHTVHVDTADILTMKAGGTYNAHNPQSNLSNGVGIAPVLEMLTRGQKVCLGSDGFFNLAHQVGLAQMMQTTASGVPGALSDRQALSMLYGNNIQMAEEVFDCRMGKIREGYTADLILVKYEPLIPLTQNTVHSETLRALQSGRVTTVMVDGSLVMLNDVLMGMDESEIDYNARAAAAGIHERLS